MKTPLKNAVLLLLAALMVLSMTACLRVGPADTEFTETDPPLPSDTVDSGEVTDSESDPTDSESDTADTTDTDETDPPETERIYSYLTGEDCTAEEQNKRPTAIMVGNSIDSLPQVGVRHGSIFYECPAEGGITRLMMVVENIGQYGTIGSVRSARDYFIDFTFNHDATYVHAGGSPAAFQKLRDMNINNLNGLNILPPVFWRDYDRMSYMAMEHTLMITGSEVAMELENVGYRDELGESFVPPFSFYEADESFTPDGDPAEHIHIRMTAVQTVDFVYNAEKGEYLRYQYDGQPHVDGETGEQLSFKNLIVLFTDTAAVPGDDKGRITVRTTGEGDGYYMTNGRYLPIKWSRAGAYDSVTLTYENGEPLVLNVGKTFITVADDASEGTMYFNYEW